MRYWWVNQNQTYRQEVKGGFLWSPKLTADGRRNEFYENMTKVEPGDLVFSFAETLVKAVGTVTAPAESSEKPDFGGAGHYWDQEGWHVQVSWHEVSKPVHPKSFVAELIPHFQGKYDPLQKNGNGNQGVYLAEISAGFAQVLLDKLDYRPPALELELTDDEIADEKALANLFGRTDIGATQKQQLVKSRRGQGVFRSNLQLNEDRCRLTGVKEINLLVASHIKPWSVSSDAEKLDGCNGLLLAPHIDRLFDRGLISFEDDGRVLKSSSVSPTVWKAWHLEGPLNGGAFSEKQSAYLAYHRKERFKP
ncbi:HNH endonuclease [Sphingomonas jaspsi]|uniref:HNH endonuclease n=1 Tax=Sphingomonas jaspsi TaxID=392409 RepID=UPI000567C3D0|nr:HNH endonuclease [Sphingomonas jaspsi]